MAISSTKSLYASPLLHHTSPAPTTTLFSSSNSSLFNNTFKPLNLVYAHRSIPISTKKTGFSCNCMFGLGVPELVVIAGVATLVFGPKQLPEIGRGFGKTIKSFQQAAKEFETELKKEPETLEEAKNTVNEMAELENEDVKSTQRTKAEVDRTKCLACPKCKTRYRRHKGYMNGDERVYWGYQSLQVSTTIIS